MYKWRRCWQCKWKNKYFIDFQSLHVSSSLSPALLLLKFSGMLAASHSRAGVASQHLPSHHLLSWRILRGRPVQFLVRLWSWISSTLLTCLCCCRCCHCTPRSQLKIFFKLLGLLKMIFQYFQTFSEWWSLLSEIFLLLQDTFLYNVTQLRCEHFSVFWTLRCKHFSVFWTDSSSLIRIQI